MRPDQHEVPPPPTEGGIRALLAAYAVGDPDQVLPLRALMAGLGRRMFGMLLFIAAIPAFIPIPGAGGVVSGPLTVILGLQLLVGLRRPWLPRLIAERGPQRQTLIRFSHRLAPWLTRLEHLIRPRMPGVLDHRAASMVTGLLIVLLGILLALPIPFTNYLFGVLLLGFALALLERDGLAMLVCWAAGLVAIAVFGILSGALAATAAHWLSLLF